MALCALVAAADGTIDPTERRKVAQLIGTNDVLRNFPAPERTGSRFPGRDLPTPPHCQASSGTIVE